MALIGSEIKSLDKNLHELDKTVKNLENELLLKKRNCSASDRKSLSRPQSSGACGIGSIVSKSPKKDTKLVIATAGASCNISENNKIPTKSESFSPKVNNFERGLIGMVDGNIELNQVGNIGLAKNNIICDGIIMENQNQYAVKPPIFLYENNASVDNVVGQQNFTQLNQLDANNLQIPPFIQHQTHNVPTEVMTPSLFPYNNNIQIAPSGLNYDSRIPARFPSQINSQQQIGGNFIGGVTQQQFPGQLPPHPVNLPLQPQMNLIPHQNMEVQINPFIPQQIVTMAQPPQFQAFVSNKHLNGGQIPQFPGIFQPSVPIIPPTQGYHQVIPNIGMANIPQHPSLNVIPETSMPCSYVHMNPNHNIPQTDQSINNNPLGMDPQTLAKYLLTAMAEECLIRKNSSGEKGAPQGVGSPADACINNNCPKSSASCGYSGINDSRTIVRPLIQVPKTNIDFSSPKSFSQDVFKPKCRRKPKVNNLVSNEEHLSDNSILHMQQESQIENEKPVSPPSSPTCFSFKASVPVNVLGDNPFSESLSRIVTSKFTRMPQPHFSYLQGK